jgi:ADP-dependent NAD(P)H-hydrate dehydratase / NAD(P)H-hydrate epimerase
MKSYAATIKDLSLAAPKRDIYSTKTQNGRLMVVGGSEDYHGAPVLASNAAYSVLAALRVGIGYAVAFVPRSVLNPVRTLSPNIIVKPMSGNNLNFNDFSMLANNLDKSQCLVIGNGLGKKADSLKTAAKLITYADKNGKRVIVDADALYAVKNYCKKLSKNVLLTPNMKEFELFYSKKLDDKSISQKIKASIEVSKRLNANILLKGHVTVVTDAERVKLITSKSSVLGTMGTGDVLSGMIAGYATNNTYLFADAVAGAYLHSIIGDRLFKEKGSHIVASDVIDYIPSVLKKFDK